MSGPVQPPLTVQTIDGTTTGRPITTIKVTNGDLTVSGNIATIDTSGGGGGGMTSFDLAGDSGATQSIGNGDTLSVLGGTGLASVASATDTVTLNIENTLVSGTTPDYYDALTINAQGQVTAVAAGTAPQAALTLTTTGTSGAATLVGATLNIPQYAAGTGTVTSVGLTETGDALTITGSPVTTSGTLNIAGAGTSSQVILGDLSLATLPTGTVDGSGSIQQVATWSDSDTLTGSTNLTFDGSNFFANLVKTQGTVTTLGTSDLTLNTNNGTNSGSIVITDGVDGDISITPNGNGRVEISGAYKLPTAVTASNNYVLTAQTDGSTAWAAASATNDFDIQLLGEALDTDGTNYNTFDVLSQAPFGVARYNTGYIGQKQGFFPFIAPKTGSAGALYWNITSPAGSAQILYAAIYDSNGNGVPETPLGWIAIDTTSSGVNTSSSWVDASGSTTVSLTRGTQYFFAFNQSNNESYTYRSISYDYASRYGTYAGMPSTSNGYGAGLVSNSTVTSAPAAVTADGLEPVVLFSSIGWPCHVGLVI